MTTTTSSTAPLLRLLQLASPSLPIGAYAYSQGLEAAVEQGSVQTEGAAAAWICGLLEHSLALLDLPIFLRFYRAWMQKDENALTYWSQFLCATRESKELLMEEEHLGESLRKVLAELGITEALPSALRATYVGYFALGAVAFKIPEETALSGYCFAWAEHQVSAASRLIPLGPMANQRVLSQVLAQVPAAAECAFGVADVDIGASLPRQAMGSALHETQYSRIFRS